MEFENQRGVSGLKGVQRDEKLRDEEKWDEPEGRREESRDKHREWSWMRIQGKLASGRTLLSASILSLDQHSVQMIFKGVGTMLFAGRVPLNLIRHKGTKAQGG